MKGKIEISFSQLQGRMGEVVEGHEAVKS